jgi:DNA-binding transcriptional LysR family regulator
VLNPVHLHTLRACVRTRSFAEAARELGYTSSAVSQQMFQLERSVGAALFERSARSVRPTAVAEQLAERSGAALGALSTLDARRPGWLAADAGFAPRIAFRSNDYGVIRELVARELGVAMLPALAWPGGGVRAVPLAGRRPFRQVLVLYRPDNTNPMLPLALDCLEQACAEFRWD